MNLEVSPGVGFTNLAMKPIKHSHISCPKTPITTLPDGSMFTQNESGRIDFASYSCGDTMINHREYIVLISRVGEHWFGDKNNRWFRLD